MLFNYENQFASVVFDAGEKVLENKVKYPKVFEMRNLNSPRTGTFEPFKVLSISGINLKINALKEDEGLFQTNPQGETTKTAVVIRKSNILLQSQIPELEPGSYAVSIPARLNNHVLRTTALEELIVIS